jgi:lipopolysaccharide export system protein LptA
MRSILLVAGTILLTFGAFVAYRALQGVPTILKGSTGPAVQPVVVNVKSPRVGPAGMGDRPWIRNIDRLGRLASQFKADQYQPRGGGRVHVIEPRAEFFQYSGGHEQMITIEGETGDIVVQEPADSGSATFEKGSAGPPKRGKIKRGVRPVIIRLYPDIVAQKDHVSITLTTDNLKFDNETFEVSTDAIVDQNGNVTVPADQVPIHVTGDYDFEGKGLIVHWNDLEGRLEYLEVTHGEYLTIVHPSGTTFGGSDSNRSAGGEAGSPPAASPVEPSTQPAPSLPGDGATVANAVMTVPPASVAPPAAAIPASATIAPAVHKPQAAKPGKHGPAPPYLADFERDVRITQGARGSDEKQMATAAHMNVDFMLKPSTQPTTAPATQPTGIASTPGSTNPEAAANQASDLRSPADVAGNAPSTGSTGSTSLPQAPTTGPVAVASTQPSAQPTDATEPVNVYWVGKLVVQPNPNLSPGALLPGQSIVHLTGDAVPVHVTRDANDVVSAKLDYYSPEGNVSLYNSPEFPQVVVRQLPVGDAVLGAQADPESAPPDDAVITSERIDYSAIERVAVLHGKSEALVQLKADPSDPAGPSKPGVLDLRWQRLARIYFLNHAAPPAGSAQARSALSPQAGSTSSPQAASPQPPAGKRSPGKSPQQLVVDHAHFEGDVDVRHPQLALKSQLLDATFASVVAPVPGNGAVVLPSPRPPGQADPGKPQGGGALAAATATTLPATAPREQTILRHLVATDAVTCVMTDEGGKKQNVECHLLTMDTALSPVGKLYPKKIDFFGDAQADAHAFDPTQDIHAGQIGLTFVPTAPTTAPTTKPVVAVALATGPSTPHTTAPSTQPTTRPVELETMTAMDRVRVKTTEGGFASAERLYVQMIEGQPHARLTGRPGAAPGSPESLATVIDAKKNIIIGPTIVSDPKQNIATVEGPGSLHLIRQDKPTDKPRPIDVVFRTRAVMDSPDNVIDIIDTDSVISPDPDGTINTANGRNVHITLADKPPEPPTTRPTTHPARPTTGPSTRPADSPGADLMKGKVVTGVVLEKDAVVKSTLTDPAGAILRQSELKADLIRYVLTSTQPGAKGTFIVPAPGQMLVRDHRPPAPPATAPSTGPKTGSGQAGKAPAPPPAQANAGDSGSSRGATAFQWSKQLTYDEATNTAVFTGDVLIVHQDDDAKQEPARLRADKVVAVFEPRPNPAAKPATTQPGAAPQPGSQLQLKSMTATGNVVVTRGASELDAPQMDYDPVSGWMVATGTPREPARFVDATGVNSANAARIDWNAQTWDVKLKGVISRTGRKPVP